MSSKLTWKILLLGGRVCIKYHPDGNLVFGSTTTGTSWKAATIGQPAQDFEAHEDAVNGLAVSHDGRRIATFSNDGTVLLWSWPNPADKDGTVKIIDVSNSSQARKFKAHDGQVKGIAFDPQRQLLATAGSDGHINIYDYTKSDTRVGNVVAGAPVALTEKSTFEMDWHPNGKSLAVPTLQGVALVLAPETDSGSWTVVKLEEYKQEAFTTHWSANGRYLASGHADSHLLIWDASKRITLDRIKCPEVPLSLQWNKTANAIVVVLANGRHAEWTGVIAKSLPDPVRPFDAASLAAAEYDSQKKALDSMNFGDEVPSSPVPASTSDNPPASTIATLPPSATASLAALGNVAPSARAAAPTATKSSAMDTDDHRSEARSNGHQRSRPSARDYPDMHSDDGDAGYGRSGFVSGYGGVDSGAEMQPPFMPSATQSGASRRFLVWNSVGSIVARVEEFPSVQTSMEMDFADTSLYKPFSITQPLAIDLATIGPQGVFTSARGFLQFQMFQKFGAKSDWAHKLNDGELAVSLAVGDHWSAVATNLRRLRLFGEAGAKLAVLSLPGPVISTCAHGPLLAVFFHSGVPSSSNGLPLSFSDAVRTRDSDEDDGAATQTIGWWVFHVGSRRLVSTGSPLPLSAGSRLTWCGFSSEGSLCTFDSAGVLRQLAGTRKFIPASTPLVSVDSRHAMSAIEPAWSDLWFEVLDSNEHRSKKRNGDAFGDDTYGADELEQGTEVWPISVSGEKLRYIKCRREDGPNVQPKPVPSYLPLAMPFGAGSERADSQENVAIRSVVSIGAAIGAAIEAGLDVEGVLGAEVDEILPLDDDEAKSAKFVLDLATDKQILGAQAKLDKAVLGLLREASQEGRVERALGLAKTLVLKKSVAVAIQVASKTGQSGLANKIDEWSRRREAERKKLADATSRMVATPVGTIPAELLASLESQSLAMANDWEEGRKNGAKRSSETMYKSKAPPSGGSDDEFEVEDEEDEDGEMPAAKKFVTQAIDSDDDGEHGITSRSSKKRGMDVDNDNDENDAEENGAPRGTNGSVFKSSPFSTAPPFIPTSGKLVDTLSSIGKAKNAGATASRVNGAPFQSPKKNLRR